MNGRDFLSNSKFFSDYAKYIPSKGRLETWGEATDDVLLMHSQKYKHINDPEFWKAFNKAREAYNNKMVLASQRNLQFRHEQITKHNSKLYNCSVVYVNKPRVFSEIMYQLLCGCGVGYSIQRHNVEQLPLVSKRSENFVEYTIPDSIEGWADALGILTSSFFSKNQHFPEYYGKKVIFNYDLIRAKGAFISGGFKAPGPDGLKKSLDAIERIFERVAEGHLTSLDVHDILCHASDAVLSGGVRRSAMIALFDINDELMLNCKTGMWFNDNPQRGRANNSAILVRDEVTKEQFLNLIEKTKSFGEPGIFFAEKKDVITNPCVTSDTKILTEEDGYVPVDELIGRKFTTIVDGELYESTDKGFFSTGIQPVYRVYTSPDTEPDHTFNKEVKYLYIDCTEAHQLLVLNEDGSTSFKELKNISLGDKLVINNIFKGVNDLVLYETVIEKEYIGDREVYDCQIPGINRYDSNGFISHNCGEIGFTPIDDETGETGWSMCNLTEINALKCQTLAQFLEACECAATLGTMQAGYTDFPYLGEVTERIIRKEALLGVSITGFMGNPKLLNPEWLRLGAERVKETNKKIAKLIGINPAARTTCVKPSGNASAILGTTSGVHGEHSPAYFRIMQLNKETELAKYLSENFPEIIEEGVWSANNSDYALYIPIVAESNSIYKEELINTKLLEYVKLIQENWVEPGTNVELGIRDYVRHNVSNTITVDNWDEVAEWVWENRNIMGGMSFLSNSGDKIYQQAPFTSVLNSVAKINETYGDGALFASGLIVDGLHAFDNNLWNACDAVSNKNNKLIGTRVQILIQKDWIRRAKSFAKNFFKGDIEKMINCLKDVHLFHKWHKINRRFKHIDFNDINFTPKYADIDTLGAVACSGGACEI